MCVLNGNRTGDDVYRDKNNDQGRQAGQDSPLNSLEAPPPNSAELRLSARFCFVCPGAVERDLVVSLVSKPSVACICSSL